MAVVIALPVKARTFLVPTSWSSLDVSEVDMALISCQQATCRACDLSAVGVPLPWPAALRLGKAPESIGGSQIQNSVAKHARANPSLTFGQLNLTITLPITSTLFLIQTLALTLPLSPHVVGYSGVTRKGEGYICRM